MSKTTKNLRIGPEPAVIRTEYFPNTGLLCIDTVDGGDIFLRNVD
jgi:hypothetical protein